MAGSYWPNGNHYSWGHNLCFMHHICQVWASRKNCHWQWPTIPVRRVQHILKTKRNSASPGGTIPPILKWTSWTLCANIQELPCDLGTKDHQPATARNPEFPADVPEHPKRNNQLQSCPTLPPVQLEDQIVAVEARPSNTHRHHADQDEILSRPTYSPKEVLPRPNSAGEGFPISPEVATCNRRWANSTLLLHHRTAI